MVSCSCDLFRVGKENIYRPVNNPEPLLPLLLVITSTYCNRIVQSLYESTFYDSAHRVILHKERVRAPPFFGFDADRLHLRLAIRSDKWDTASVLLVGYLYGALSASS